MIQEAIERIQHDLRNGRFTNEAAVSQGVVLPLLHELGWPVFNTQIVVPEYALEGRRVDFALCDTNTRPKAFLEVKRVGEAEGGDRQLFEYAFHRGVPLAILTDGQEWSFYLPGEEGHYEERRVYKLDLLERAPDQCVQRLTRYLGHGRILAGEALQAARADYQDAARVRQIEATLPKAWRELIESQDSILVELIADKVEDMCGYKPDLDTCSRFLGQIASGGQVLARTGSVSNASGASTLRAPNRPPSASQATTKTGSLLRAYFMALAQQEKSCRKFFDSLRNATAHSWSDSPLGNMARSDVLSLETELSSTQEDQIFPNIPSN